MNSRRELLAASLTGGAAAGLASFGGGSQASSLVPPSTPPAHSDAVILGALLDQENSSIAAYMVVASRVRGAALASAQHFLGHERRHAAALSAAIRALGSAPEQPRPRSEYEAGFPRLRNERDALS